MTTDSNLYEDIRVIGYTKRPMSLRNRCIPAVIKCDTEINSNTKIEDLYTTQDRVSNIYSPCEVFMKMFPDRSQEIIDILKNQESNPSTAVYI